MKQAQLLTNEQLIEALKYCSSNKICRGCPACEMRNQDAECFEQLMEEAAKRISAYVALMQAVKTEKGGNTNG